MKLRAQQRETPREFLNRESHYVWGKRYRDQIKLAVSSLIPKWEAAMSVKVDRLFVRQMKTKWGTCNPRTRSIRLNTELAKKRPELLEYVVVHELAHLLVRHH